MSLVKPCPFANVSVGASLDFAVAAAAYFVWLNRYRSEFPHSKVCCDQVHTRSSFDEHRQILQLQRLTDEKIEAATERFGASSVRTQRRDSDGFRRTHVMLPLVRADALDALIPVHLAVVRKQCSSLSKLDVATIRRD